MNTNLEQLFPLGTKVMLKFSPRARSSYLRISVSPYQGIGLSMYQRIKEGMGKGKPAAELHELVVKVSALAGAESQAAIPTQGRDGGNVAPQRHGGPCQPAGPLTPPRRARHERA
jgi:hypothetical protein